MIKCSICNTEYDENKIYCPSCNHNYKVDLIEPMPSIFEKTRKLNVIEDTPFLDEDIEFLQTKTIKLKEIKDIVEESAPLEATIKIDKTEIENKLKEESVTEKETTNNFIYIIINFLLTIGFLGLFYVLPVVVTKKSGNYTIMEYLNWFIPGSDKAALIGVIIYLVISTLSFGGKKKSNIFTKISYILMIGIEIAFMVIMNEHAYHVNNVYYVFIAYTFVWLVITFIISGSLKNDLDNENDLAYDN